MEWSNALFGAYFYENPITNPILHSWNFKKTIYFNLKTVKIEGEITVYESAL